MIESIIPAILASIPGFASLFIYIYILRKKSKKTVKAVGFSGVYKIAKQEKSKMDVLVGEANITLLNDRDDSVTITDIIGSVHYDKKRYKINEGLIIKSSSSQLPYVISSHPQNFVDIIPKVIKPHEAVKIKLDFVFTNVFANLLYRAIPARFGGFVGDNPILVSSEIEYIKKWDSLPILLYITFHIDAKEDIKAVANLEKEKTQGVYQQRGTYWSTDTARIGRDIWREKW